MLTYDELLSLPFQLRFHQIFHSKTILILYLNNQTPYIHI